ncbi:DNA-directed RNA polymerase subunit H [Candidatus Woesearchaeota archaeon]|nr:DNA-directed RNA polymerase subunit H [Candidatus Woesearchaeota archaeon]
MADDKKKSKKVTVDLTAHTLVPKHEIVSKEEINKILERYNITIYQLPRILAEDPVVKVINAKTGDIIKVTRKSPTIGESHYYRLVSDE